jgi:hypothetical protein
MNQSLKHTGLFIISFFMGLLVWNLIKSPSEEPKTVIKVTTKTIHKDWTVPILVVLYPKPAHDTMWIDSSTKYKTYIRTFKDSIATTEVTSVVEGELKGQGVKSTYNLKEYHHSDSIFITKETTITKTPMGLYLGANSSGIIGASFIKGRWSFDAGYAVVKDQFGNRIQAGVKYRLW